MIIGIDPGPVNSAYAVANEDDYKPVEVEILPNDEVLKRIANAKEDWFVIEMVASYGMAVGKDVFETVCWIGRFYQAAIMFGFREDMCRRIYRGDVKMNLCQSMRAKDANVNRALVDRFAQHDLKSGKGTKKNPDWFYGFNADKWAAYGVVVTFADILNGRYEPRD